MMKKILQEIQKKAFKVYQAQWDLKDDSFMQAQVTFFQFNST